MAVGAWTIFHKFKEYMADNTIDMDGAIFRVALHTNSSNLTANLVSTVTVWQSVTGEVASVGGYSTSGKTLSAPTWATGASSGEMRFDATAVFWSVTADLSNIQWAVIFVSAGTSATRFLVAYSKLSTSQFDLTNTNRLTITPDATNGIFELN
jgi:hypothetical protein